MGLCCENPAANRLNFGTVFLLCEVRKGKKERKKGKFVATTLAGSTRQVLA
jgi:hypothetical protein